MLWRKNLEALAGLGFEHLTAMPLKREASNWEIIEATHEELVERARQAERGLEEGEKVPDVLTEVEVEDGRVVVAYSKTIARTEREQREARLGTFDEKASYLEARLRGKVPGRGRPLTDEGAFKQLVKEALEKKVTAYFRIEMRGAFLWVEPLEEAEEYAKKCDGKLALHTDNRDLGAKELHRIYKDLQEIERWWRTLKSFVKIRPTHHWTERRVRAHVFLCVLALFAPRRV